MLDDCQQSVSTSYHSDEEIRSHCTFYQRIGACRHGEKCSRVHEPPKKSRIILLKNMYRTAKLSARVHVEALFFKEFLSEVLHELEESYGKVSMVHVCDNIGGHLHGHVYVKFSCAAAALKAVHELSDRWFAGSLLDVSLSPLRDFREARCRQHDNGTCARGGHCNFMHLHAESPGSALDGLRELGRRQFSTPQQNAERRKSKSRSTSSERLPKRYQIVDNSSGSSSSSTNSPSCSSDSESGNEVPKAFRSAILDSEDDGEPSEEELELARARLRFERKRKWSAVRSKFEAQIRWDEDREQNFVFSLL